MAARTFRLCVSPEGAADVRRVFDFNGRASLADVHVAVVSAYALLPKDEPYAFFLSGRFWDASTAVLDPRAKKERADKALLFRLGLTPSREVAYVYGFKTEQRFIATVLSVADVVEPLAAPVLVESVGDLAAQVVAPEAFEPEVDPPEISELTRLAEDFLDLDDELDLYADAIAAGHAQAEPWEKQELPLEHISELATRPVELAALDEAKPILLQAASAAEKVLQALAGDLQAFQDVDHWLLERAFGPRFLELPMSLALVGEVDRAVALARAMTFIDPELLEGDIAVILARAGKREEALAQLAKNLNGARDASLVEAKAGDTHRALGDAAAAEAYYRQSLALAKTPSDRLHALLRLVTCLTDTGRDAEANELLQQARQARGEPVTPKAVGRNDPCPCGSGKKYKKCHGA